MLNTGLSQSTTRTALDAVFFQEYDYKKQPGLVDATDPVFFRQDKADGSAVITEDLQGPGDFETHAEEQEVDEATMRTGNQKTHTILEYARGIHIPVSYYEDAKFGMINEQVRQFGMRARTSRDKHAFNNSYADAFSGVTATDSVAWASNSHTTLSGDTVDNLETGVLTPANLETVVRSLALQRTQDGFIGSHEAVGLLVPKILHPDAQEITKSTKQANTAENNLNYFSDIYPGMVVGWSPFLDSTYNTLNSNANTSYFVVGRNHFCKRFVRKELSTNLRDYSIDTRLRYWYHARFREIVSIGVFEGMVASNGTA